MPSVQRSLYLNELTKNCSNIHIEVPKGVLTVEFEVCWNNVWRSAERQQEIKQKGDPVHERTPQPKEVRGYYKQFAEAKHLEYKSWFDDEVFALVDLR